MPHVPTWQHGMCQLQSLSKVNKDLTTCSCQHIASVQECLKPRSAPESFHRLHLCTIDNLLLLLLPQVLAHLPVSFHPPCMRALLTAVTHLTATHAQAQTHTCLHLCRDIVMTMLYTHSAASLRSQCDVRSISSSSVPFALPPCATATTALTPLPRHGSDSCDGRG